jgi:uncharacterized membrane protein
MKKLRLAWPPPWDLIASALISILTLVLIQMSFPSMEGFIALLGLILVILIPGYLFVLSLFPGRSDLSSRRRALLSLGFAALLAALASLGLIFTPRGLQPASLATILSLLALFLSAFAYARSSELPSRKRFTLGSKRGSRSGKRLTRASRAVPKSRIISLFFVLLIGVLATLAFTLNANQGSSSEKGYTEFNVSWPKGTEYEAASLQAGSKITAQARIFNHENGLINYTLRLSFSNKSLFSENLMLSRNESWEGPVSGILNGSLGRQRLDFLLFKEGDLSMPYRQNQLWVNLTEDKSDDSMNFSKLNRSSDLNGSLDLNASEKVPPVTLEQDTRVVVQSIGDDSGGGSGSAVPGIKPSSSQIGQDSKIDQESEAPNSDHVQGSIEQKKEITEQKSSKEDASGKQQGSEKEVDLSLQKVEKSDGVLDSKKNSEGAEKSSENEAIKAEQAVSLSGSPIGEKNNGNPAEIPDSNAPKKDAEITLSSDTKRPSDSTTDSSEPSKDKGADGNSGDYTGANSPKEGGVPDSGVSRKDGSKTSGIAKEIDSWVSTRGMGSSEKSQSGYVSGNIRYVKESTGERAVLGRAGENPAQTSKTRSKKPVRLG